MSLGHPAYARPKGTEDQSMPEKRGTVEVSETWSRKTRVAGPKLNCVRCGSSDQYLLPSRKAIG
jgi:hypothetical protein